MVSSFAFMLAVVVLSSQIDVEYQIKLINLARIDIFIENNKRF